MLHTETDCQIWTCYEYDPPSKTKNYLSIIAVIITIISLLALILFIAFKLRLKPAPLERSQVLPQTTEQNRNSYFSLASSSSKEDLDLRTQIIRPRTRGPINHQ